MKNMILLSVTLMFVVTTPVNVTNKVSIDRSILVAQRTQYKGDVRLFMKRLGYAEGREYSTVGGYKNKYLGMYQFHPTTLRKLGLRVTKEEFLNNPALQDSAMIQYMRDNAKNLHDVIAKFNHTYVHGVYITKSGILAGAHLIGSAGILSFFYPEKFSYPTSDGNGTNVSVYIEKFANYNLSEIQ